MLIYVAGPYRPYSSYSVSDNIADARKVAIALWEKGHTVICPHLNTAHFEDDCAIPDSEYLRRDLQILARCDAIVLTERWQDSRGANDEFLYANQLGIPMYRYPRIPELDPTEERSPIQVQAFVETLMQMYRLHLAKNHDYSPACYSGTGLIGISTRIWEKTARLMSLMGFRIQIASSHVEPKAKPQFESVSETFLDLAVIGIIGVLIGSEKWDK